MNQWTHKNVDKKSPVFKPTPAAKLQNSSFDMTFLSLVWYSGYFIYIISNLIQFKNCTNMKYMSSELLWKIQSHKYFLQNA
jgi:hypothetical protein